MQLRPWAIHSFIRSLLVCYTIGSERCCLRIVSYGWMILSVWRSFTLLISVFSRYYWVLSIYCFIELSPINTVSPVTWIRGRSRNCGCEEWHCPKLCALFSCFLHLTSSSYSATSFPLLYYICSIRLLEVVAIGWTEISTVEWIEKTHSKKHVQ